MKLIAFLAFLFLSNPGLINNTESTSPDDTGKILFSGTVIEELTGEPVPGACITIRETDQEIYTDFDGNFSVEEFTPGTYTIEVSFVSFEKEEFRDFRIDRENNSMLIRLN